MTAYAQPNNNAAIFWLLLLAAAFIVAVYTMPQTIPADMVQDYCTCTECSLTVPCGDLQGGKCAACRWLAQHKGGRHARH